MASFVEGTFVNGRKQTLYYRHWEAVGKAHVKLILHHGYGYHCADVHDYALKRLAEAGISVFVFDAHSFGRSEPKAPKQRSLVENYQHFIDDIYTFRKEVVDKAPPGPPVPVFLGGFSMGGMAAIAAALQDQSKWQGLVILSPALGAPPTFQLRVLGVIVGVLLRIIPGVRLFPGPQTPDMTHNQGELKVLLADPLIDHDKLRVCTINMFLRAWQFVEKREQELRLPLLTLYSSIDKVVYVPATERFLRNVASTDKTVKPFDKFGHDLLLDTCKVEVTSTMIDWILARAGGGGQAVPAAAGGAAVPQSS